MTVSYYIPVHIKILVTDDEINISGTLQSKHRKVIRLILKPDCKVLRK